jgi:hypothetical protein
MLSDHSIGLSFLGVSIMLIISRTDKWKPFDEELDHQEPERAEVTEVAGRVEPTTLAESGLEPVLPLPAVMAVVLATPVKAA